MFTVMAINMYIYKYTHSRIHLLIHLHITYTHIHILITQAREHTRTFIARVVRVLTYTLL